MVAIEKDNPSLKGVLPKDYTRPSLDKQRLGSRFRDTQHLIRFLNFWRPKYIDGKPVPIWEKETPIDRCISHAIYCMHESIYSRQN
jgi:hypothetical protein